MRWSDPKPLRYRGALLHLLLCLSLVGCATQSRNETRSKQTTGLLVLQTDVDVDAIVDGGAPKRVTANQEHTFVLSPGEHRLEVVRPEFTTRRFDLNIKANEATVIQVQMWPIVEELDDEP